MPRELISSVISLFLGRKKQGKPLPYIEIKNDGDGKAREIDVMQIFGVPKNRLDSLLLEFSQAAERQGTRTVEGIRSCFDVVAKKSLTANEFAAAIWVISSKCTENVCKREAFRSEAFERASVKDSSIM